MILGANGLPVHSDRSHVNGSAPKSRASSLFSATDYLQALDTIGAPARTRSREPLTNHPWVFAAAIMIAMVAGQATFRVFRETEKTVGRRKELARRAGRLFSRRFGHERTAIQRHGMTMLERRTVSTALEPDDEHEVSALLRRPNPLQDGTQLMGTTFLGLAADSEFFWIRTGKGGTRIGPNTRPVELWPVLGSQVREVHARQTGGEIIGWEIRRPKWMPGGGVFAAEKFRLDEVIVFKGPNPSNPARGLSRLTAAASAIEADMLAKAFQRDHLRRGGTPKGFIKFKGEMNEADKRKFLTKIREEYEGAEATGRIGLLEGDFDWEQLGGQIEDIQFLEQLRNDREEILAVLGVPPSQLGAVQFTNYATALAQNKVFWENTIGPMLRTIESALDSTLFFSEPDDVVGLFDVSSVEALLAGLADKITAAEQLSKETLHVPPRIAFERVGIEMPEYDGDDIAFVGALATPAKVAIEIAQQEEDAVNVDPADDEDDEVTDPDDDEEIDDEAAADVPTKVHGHFREAGGIGRRRAPGVIVRSAKDDRIKRMRQFVKVETGLERVMRVRYRRWVAQEREATLKRFDKAARDAKKLLSGASPRLRAFDMSIVLPDLAESGNALQLLVRPVYAGILTETYDFTADDIGMPTFEIDDDALIRVLAQREKHFTARMPKRVSEQLMRTMNAGIQAGETMEQIRQRVDTVYKFSASKQKSLVVARTETAGAMNGVRDEMFGLAGVDEQFWTNAEDAAVRPSHEVFGDSGAHPRGFNFMSLIGEAGSLTFPNDPNGPAKEVIQCRCVAIPA